MTRTLVVRGLDHIVINCRDVEKSLAFYCGTLGLAGVRVDEWRRAEVPFPSARVDASTIIDLLHGEPTGENMNHFCLTVDPMDFAALASSGTFEVVDGPATRFGAQGDGTSLYVRDPDANVVELRYYPD